MFQGSIPEGVRKLIAEVWRGWPAQARAELWVGCSGNFTIERMISAEDRPADEPAPRLHGNDVSVYSCALGWLLAGEPLPYRLKDEHRDQLGWLEEFLDDGPGTMATLMLCSRFLNDYGRPGAFFERMTDANRRAFPEMWAKTKAKLEDVPTRLASYRAMDVQDYLAQVVPADATFASFPPFWVNGYAKMFEGLDRVFHWPTPDFRWVDEAGKEQLVARATNREHWVLGMMREYEALRPHLRGVVRASVGSVPVWMYSSGVASRIVLPVNRSRPLLVPKIGRDEDLDFDGGMDLIPLDLQQFVGLRQQYMNVRIEPAPPRIMRAVTVGGKVIGAFGYRDPRFDPNCAYLLSDFAVSWSKYKRLSKLVVMAATSVEANRAIERDLRRRMFAWATTAFSDNPTAQKYERGVPGIRCTGRTRTKKGEAWPWQLQYGGPLGQWTLAEGLALWRKKHGHVMREREDAP